MDVTFSPKRIACISTSRADAGIYRPLLKCLVQQGGLEVSVLAGGTHHDTRYGMTAVELRADPKVEIIRVEHFVPGDGPLEVARSAGGAVTEFSRAIDRWMPDLVFVLGDRTEMLAAALAALIHSIPIAHLHGGDASEGAYDEQCRHAITKLAHLHFPALPQHAERIEAMGEARWRIHVVGAPALDGLAEFVPMSVEQLQETTGLDFSRPTLVVVYHPETLSGMPPRVQVDELLGGLSGVKANMLILGANADVGHGAVTQQLQRFADQPGICMVANVPQCVFWSCLTHGRVLVGNSSAGLIEAASFRLPVVNVGDRQAGRFRPANVLDAPLESRAIHETICKAMSDQFRRTLVGLVNPYGDARAAERIMCVLRGLPPKQRLLRKQWSSALSPTSAVLSRGQVRTMTPRRVAPGKCG